MGNAGQFEDYDYDPPVPTFILPPTHPLPSFLCRLEEPPLPYHCQQRTTTEDNDNAQYASALQPPLRNDIRSRKLSPVAGASGRSPVHTNIDRGRDRIGDKYNGRDKERDRDRSKYRETDEHGHRDGGRAGRRASSSGRRRERDAVSRSRSRLREWHSKTPALKCEQAQWPNRGYHPQLTSYPPHPPRYSACRGYEERRRNETVSPPARRRRESGREEAEALAEDTDSMSANDILEFYNPENNQEFNEMYSHPHDPLPNHIRELSQFDGPKNLASPSREAIDAASARQVELLANYNNCLQIEQEIRNNLKQSTDFLISTVKNTKKLKERRFSCTQQHQRLQNEHSTLLAKMIPVNESWMDITSKELGLITAVLDNLKLMETADGFNEIDKLNAESNELQRQLEQIRENGLEIHRQLQAFRDAEKNIANKLIEAAKKEFECARQELYRSCPDLANKFD